MIYRANVIVLGELGIPLSREWFRERYTPDWRASYRELGVPEDRWDAVAARWTEEMQAGTAARDPVGRAARCGGWRGTASAWAWSPPRRAASSSRTCAGSTSRACSRRPTSPTTSRRASRTRRRCCARWRTWASTPADSIYVGDTTVDLAMASAAGAPFEAVAGTTTRGRVPRGRRRAGVGRASAPGPTTCSDERTSERDRSGGSSAWAASRNRGPDRCLRRGLWRGPAGAPIVGE